MGEVYGAVPEPLGERPHSRAAILAVDDYPANLLAIKRILDPLGHEVVRAHSGEQALRAPRAAIEDLDLRGALSTA